MRDEDLRPAIVAAFAHYGCEILGPPPPGASTFGSLERFVMISRRTIRTLLPLVP